jgi:hypothetical protein
MSGGHDTTGALYFGLHGALMSERTDDDEDGADVPLPQSIPAGPKDARDDFFCLRFRVWYPSEDCAFRTRYRTSPGCLACDQGRFNLARHAGSLPRLRWPIASGD